MSGVSLNPLTIRTVLFILLFIGIGVSASSFIYAQDFLRKYATEVNHKVIDARASNSTIQSLKDTQKELIANQDVRKRIGLLRSNDQFPEFRIVDEVQKVAKQNNVAIRSFSYKDAATGESTQNPAATPTQVSNASGNKTITLLVDVESPIDYKTLLEFIYDIEQHLPKMNINGISLTPAESPDKVSVAQLSVEMYVK